MNRKVLKKKGSYMIASLGVFMMGLTFVLFAWDTSRLLYYKVHNQNLASTIAISIANETRFFYEDESNRGHGFLVTRGYNNGKKPKGYTGKFADDPYLASTIVGFNDVKGADHRLLNASVNNNYQDKDRFIKGRNADGDGEVEVKTTMEIDLFFSKVGSMFTAGYTGPTKKVISNIAVARAYYIYTGGSTVNKNITIWEDYEIL